MVIIGSISVCDCMDSILFDLGFTCSYVSIQFVVGLNLVMYLINLIMCLI